jgi:hypothetical protein
MTIHIDIKHKDDPQSEIAVSGVYNGTVWLSYAEQVELLSWFLNNRKDVVQMINNRRFKESLSIMKVGE